MDTAGLRRDHRRVEAALDRLHAAFNAPEAVLRALLGEACTAVLRHYAREDAFFAAFQEIHAPLAHKLLRQHEEAREIAASEPASEAELRYIARRFQAIAQHNIIEEERDAFPLADRHRPEAPSDGTPAG